MKRFVDILRRLGRARGYLSIAPRRVVVAPFNRPKTLEEAWARDWANIGGDFRRACDRFAREHGITEGA